MVPAKNEAPEPRGSGARNRNEVHPLATALDCHIVVAAAAINRCLRVERPASFSKPAPDQLPSPLRRPLWI